jgi:FADH2 O2-dependent halogenase
VDRFFFEQARSVGVQTFEGSRHQLSRCSDTWQLKGESQGKSYNIRSPFIVDATGPAAEVLKYLHVPDQTDRLGTHSQALYAHFDNVLPVRELLTAEGISVAPHPFDCDAAAVHQVLDNGWMWQLRFDDQSVSAGFVMNTRHASGSSAGQPGDATELWHQQLQRFPFLGRQFASARIVRPAGGIQLTTRLQRLTTQAAGPDWAALPNTAGFVDPLHSTGIAHTMFGIRRLAHILLAVADLDTRTAQLPHYSTTLINEIRLVDELVEGCYAALPDFRLWSDWCMLYFAAVTSMEQTHSAGQDTSFLLAANHEFRTVLKTARQHLQQAIDSGSTDAAADFEIWLRRNIAPWNSVGLLDDSCRGMYSNTAAP